MEKQEIFEKDTLFSLGIKQNTKRINLAEGETIAIEVDVLSALNDAPKRVIKSILKREETLKKKYLIDILSIKDKEREKGKVTKETKDGVIEKKEDVQEEVKADGLMSSKAYSESNRVIERVKEREEMLKQLRKEEGKEEIDKTMKETTEVQSEEKHMNDGLPKTVKEQMLDELIADKERMQGQLNEPKDR